VAAIGEPAVFEWLHCIPVTLQELRAVLFCIASRTGETGPALDAIMAEVTDAITKDAQGTGDHIFLYDPTRMRASTAFPSTCFSIWQYGRGFMLHIADYRNGARTCWDEHLAAEFGLSNAFKEIVVNFPLEVVGDNCVFDIEQFLAPLRELHVTRPHSQYGRVIVTDVIVGLRSVFMVSDMPQALPGVAFAVGETITLQMAIAGCQFWSFGADGETRQMLFSVDGSVITVPLKSLAVGQRPQMSFRIFRNRHLGQVLMTDEKQKAPFRILAAALVATINARR